MKKLLAVMFAVGFAALAVQAQGIARLANREAQLDATQSKWPTTETADPKWPAGDQKWPTTTQKWPTQTSKWPGTNTGTKRAASKADKATAEMDVQVANSAVERFLEGLIADSANESSAFELSVIKQNFKGATSGNDRKERFAAKVRLIMDNLRALQIKNKALSSQVEAVLNGESVRYTYIAPVDYYTHYIRVKWPQATEIALKEPQSAASDAVAKDSYIKTLNGNLLSKLTALLKDVPNVDIAQRFERVTGDQDYQDGFRNDVQKMLADLSSLKTTNPELSTDAERLLKRGYYRYVVDGAALFDHPGEWMNFEEARQVEHRQLPGYVM